jgi:hypothetical protein
MLLTAAAVGLFSAGVVRAEDWNGYVPLKKNANNFELVFKGNIVSSLNIPAIETDPGINPFCWAVQKAKGTCGASTSKVTATYSGDSTTVTFTGPTLAPGASNIPNQTEYHFGLDPAASNGTGPQLSMVLEYWTFTTTKTTTKTPLPILTANAPPVGTGTIKYEVFFANILLKGQTVGFWYEVPYTGSTPPTFSPINYSGSPETLSNVGFQLSPTLIPLDNLNFNDFPPPGQPGSTFTDLPQYDGSLISTGVPEPSTWVMMLAGFLGLGYAAYRASRKSAALALAA